MKYTYSVVAADGITDDTADLAGELAGVAAGGGCLILPPGQILVTEPITITGPNRPFSVMGAGPVATQIVGTFVQDDLLTFDSCNYAHFRDFGVTVNREAMTGALVNIKTAYRLSMDHVSISEGFVNLRLGNVVGSTFRRLYLSGGTYFSEALVKYGSYNLLVDADRAGVNNGLDFDGCYFEGGQTGNHKYGASIGINNVDGCWFRGGHVYGAHFEQVAIVAAPAVTSVLFDGVYFEHGAMFGIVLKGQPVDAITVNACQFNHQTTAAIAVDGMAPPGCIITNNRGVGTLPLFPASVVANNLH